jgi:serine/threonine protein kinase
MSSQPNHPAISFRPPALGDEVSATGGMAYTSNTPYISRARSYAFVVDERGLPIELGSGRYAKAFLGEELWSQSKTTFRRHVAIKILQRGVSPEDALRFQVEKEILERVQGHPNIVEILASGEADNPNFIPPPLRDKIDNDFLVLELMDMSLEERLKGTRQVQQREDLLALPADLRLARVLEYVVPVANAIEYAHRVRDTSHRDIKPANILLKLPDPALSGATMQIKLADFNVGNVGNFGPAHEPDTDRGITRHQTVPGTLYFQSPEQETNSFDLLVDVTQGSPEVDYFEDFYIDIFENDSFQIFNRAETYAIVGADRARKKLVLSRPFTESSEYNVRGRVIKQVGRPADIYSLGALLYYLISGAYANPKSLYDAFRRFIEYERRDQNNTVTAYIEHEYGRIHHMRAPRADGAAELAPSDRFFSYKHFLDGNGELIDPAIMLVVAKAMIRNKPDSYCYSWDVTTDGVSLLIRDLLTLYATTCQNPALRPAWSAPAPERRRRRWTTSRGTRT